MNKNFKKYIILAVAIVLVIVGCASVFLINHQKNKQIEVYASYVDLLNNKKYEEMYDMLSDESKSKITKDDFVKRNKNIYEGIEAEDIKISNEDVKKEGDEKKVSYTSTMIAMGEELTFDNSVTLIKENREYKIKWNSSLILPDLGDDEKVSVNTAKGKRGKILDRNNKVLAEDGTLASVGVVPGKLSADTKENDIKTIASILEIEESFINDKLKASYVRDDMFVPLKTISNDDTRKTQLLSIKGIMISDKKGRVYPMGQQAAHLTGYVQPITSEILESHKNEGYNINSIIGKDGIELYYEDKLKAVDGFSINIMDKNGTLKKTVASNEAKDGQDVKLTIDSQVQANLYNELKDDKSSSASINPNTGEILALVSTPAYDPNDFVLGLTNTKWDSLNSDPNKPLFNRIVNTYVPGSSFKPIIAAIGVDTKALNPDENMNIKGLEWQKDNSWGSYSVTRVSEYAGESNLLNGLVYSDNIYFAKAALAIGKDSLQEKLKSFGVGDDLKLQYPVKSSQIGTSGEISDEIELADTGYGQGKVLVSPLQLSSMYTMFLNDGSILKPYIEYKETPEREIYKENAVSKETADLVLKDMVQVVENSGGTGHEALISGTTIAAKTGTAEIKASKDDTTGTELGWFVAMTTNKNSNMMVISMVEDVKGRGGSHYVIPKVKSVLQNVK